MSRLFLRVWVVCAALLGIVQVACSGEQPGPIGDARRTGTVGLPLTAQSGDVAYRLASARFTITGTPLGGPRVIRPPADTPVHEETLPVGSYSILLEDGWKLERKGPEDSAFSQVPAQLIVDNPQAFSVVRNAVTDVVFSFATGLGQVDLGRGRADIRIEVHDCKSYDTYAATIATLTVDCLGRIDQNSFFLDAAGFLRRNFQSCPLDDSLLQQIDNFLGLQYRRVLEGQTVDPLPFGKDCIAGRWARWRDAFDSSGVVECPDWRKAAEINTPTIELYDALAKQLPPLPFQERRDRVAVPDQLKVNSIYFVTLPPGIPGQQCGTPGACAAACAAGFPGFVIQQEGASVLTDPPAWQIDETFMDADSNPFMRPGYYHPMSLYGEPPGEIFGNINRVPEQCSYYDSGYHFMTDLKENCQFMPSGDLSCVSACYQ